MKIQFKNDVIPLSSINFSDNTYRITTDTDTAVLIRSIHTVGLLHPPLLKKRNGTFSIISGFRRMAAIRELGWKDTQGRVLNDDTEEKSIVLIAIMDNTGQRPLNLIEQSRSVHLLERICDNTKELMKIASELGFPYNPEMIHKLKRLSFLPLPVQQGILSATIPFAMALELEKLTPSESALFAFVFDSLKLSLNKQREILTLAEDICLREDMSLEQLFSVEDIQEILYGKELDKTQKTQKLRIYLRQRRYPNLFQAEKQFEKNLHKLKLGSGIQLSAPRHFEGMTYALILQFKNMAELKLRKETLENLMENQILEAMLE